MSVRWTTRLREWIRVMLRVVGIDGAALLLAVGLSTWGTHLFDARLVWIPPAIGFLIVFWLVSAPRNPRA